MRRALPILFALAIVAASSNAAASQVAPSTGHATASSGGSKKPRLCPPMPKVAPSGYKVAVSDDFAGSTLDRHKWFEWTGEPGGDPYGWWSPSQDVVAGEMIQLRGKSVSRGANPRWTSGGEVTGGIGSVHTQVYGEYEWCMRTSHSLGTKTAVLLWPQDNKWPPEIDFFENWGDPLYYCVWLHYGGPTHKIIRRVYYQYSAQWTVYLAVWRHNNLQVIENGVRVANITSPHVPNTPMRLDIETMAIQPKAVVGATVVKWVVEYVPLTG